MKQWIKPNLFFLALLAFVLNLSFAFQIANLSSIFKFLGAANSDLPLLWLVPPITGLIIQPLIGQLSDDTVSRFGKRKPYILAWGLIAAFSFALLPLTTSLTSVLILTWLINCSLNGGSECLRALTGDLTFRDQDRSKAFALQAFFSGVGGTLGAALPYFCFELTNYFHIETDYIPQHLPINFKLSMVFIGILLVCLVLICLKSIQEKISYRPTLLQKKKKPTNIFKRTLKIFRDLYRSILQTPLAFKKICVVHALSWVGVFIFWLYFTLTLAQNIFHLPTEVSVINNAEYATILQSASLNVSYYFSTYQYVSVIYAFLLYFLSNSSRNIYLHSISLLIGGISILAIGFVTDGFYLWLACVGVGILWGSMIILPYAIAIQVLPRGRLGTYLGIFNICITLPQLLCGLSLSPIYSYVFQNRAGYLLMFAGAVIIFSAFCWLRIESHAKQKSSADKRIFSSVSVS